MEASVYAQEAMVEASHWRFIGGRKLVAAEIARPRISNDAYPPRPNMHRHEFACAARPWLSASGT